MIVGCMQPYLFPYLGYFDVVNRCDRWIVFDTDKYKPRHWINRNRILHPVTGWQYFSVPIDRQTKNAPIKDVRILDKEASRCRILGQLRHYRDLAAPFYERTVTLVDTCFAETPGDSLRDLAVAGLARVCDYLGIAFDPVLLSESGIVLPAIDRPGEWALEICSALGAHDYINPPGGRALFDEDSFRRRGIRLHFTDLIDFKYDCPNGRFIEHLSIIDVLMWNPPAAVKEKLDSLKNA